MASWVKGGVVLVPTFLHGKLTFLANDSFVSRSNAHGAGCGGRRTLQVATAVAARKRPLSPVSDSSVEAGSRPTGARSRLILLVRFLSGIL